nr:glycosyltransferase [Candidatus Baldrarchaeota archaeon]
MILVVAPLPPLRTGIAIYSHKLYSEIGKYISLVILANKEASKIYKSKTKLKIIEAWDYNNPLSFLTLIIKLIKNKKKLLHLQLGYTWIKNPLVTQLLVTLLLIAAKLLGMRTIVTLHGVVTKKTLNIYFSIEKRIKTKILITLLDIIYTIHYKLLAKISDTIIVHNSNVKRKLFERINQKYKKKIVVIPHGVDTPIFGKKTTRTENEKIKFLFTGFIRRNKGIEEFIEAVNILDKTTKGKLKVIIAGSPHIGDDANYYMKIKSIIKKYRLEEVIELKNKFIPENKLNKLLGNADVIVLPYKDYFYEASGVLARVMGYGKPIICTNIPKFSSELKNRVDAIIVPPGDKESLARAIKTLTTDKDLRQKLMQNLRKKAKLREWQKIAQKHIKLYLSKL